MLLIEPSLLPQFLSFLPSLIPTQLNPAQPSPTQLWGGRRCGDILILLFISLIFLILHAAHGLDPRGLLALEV